MKLEEELSDELFTSLRNELLSSFPCLSLPNNNNNNFTLENNNNNNNSNNENNNNENNDIFTNKQYHIIQSLNSLKRPVERTSWKLTQSNNNNNQKEVHLINNNDCFNFIEKESHHENKNYKLGLTKKCLYKTLAAKPKYPKVISSAPCLTELIIESSKSFQSLGVTKNNNPRDENGNSNDDGNDDDSISVGSKKSLKHQKKKTKQFNISEEDSPLEITAASYPRTITFQSPISKHLLTKQTENSSNDILPPFSPYSLYSSPSKLSLVNHNTTHNKLDDDEDDINDDLTDHSNNDINISHHNSNSNNNSNNSNNNHQYQHKSELHENESLHGGRFAVFIQNKRENNQKDGGNRHKSNKKNSNSNNLLLSPIKKVQICQKGLVSLSPVADNNNNNNNNHSDSPNAVIHDKFQLKRINLQKKIDEIEKHRDVTTNSHLNHQQNTDMCFVPGSIKQKQTIKTKVSPNPHNKHTLPPI